MSDTRELEVVGPDGEVMHWDQQSLVADWQVQTSLPSETPEHRAVIAEIIERVELSKEAAVNNVYELSEFIAHPVVYLSLVTGKPTPGIRVLFPLPDGGLIAGCGRPLIESIQRLAWTAGRQPPWYPPIKARLISRATKGGRTFKWQYVSG